MPTAGKFGVREKHGVSLWLLYGVKLSTISKSASWQTLVPQGEQSGLPVTIETVISAKEARQYRIQFVSSKIDWYST